MGRRLLIMLSLMTLAVGATAQRQDFLMRSDLLLSGGGMGYTGDLNHQSLFSVPGAAFGLGLRYRIDNRWALCVRADKGRIGCSKDHDELRGLSFWSDIYEAGATVEFSFWNYGTGAMDRQWTFYLFGGVYGFHFNPMADYSLADGTTGSAELRPLCTEGQGSTAYPDRHPYRTVQLEIPFGVGVKWKIGKTFSLSAEYGLRRTWTDYLDDVSTTYVGAEVLSEVAADPALAAMLADRSAVANAPGIKRGDDSLNDMYSFFHITLGVSMETLLGWTRSKRCKF